MPQFLSPQNLTDATQLSTSSWFFVLFCIDMNILHIPLISGLTFPPDSAQFPLSEIHFRLQSAVTSADTMTLSEQVKLLRAQAALVFSVLQPFRSQSHLCPLPCVLDMCLGEHQRSSLLHIDIHMHVCSFSTKQLWLP